MLSTNSSILTGAYFQNQDCGYPGGGVKGQVCNILGIKVFKDSSNCKAL